MQEKGCCAKAWGDHPLPSIASRAEGMEKEEQGWERALRHLQKPHITGEHPHAPSSPSKIPELGGLFPRKYLSPGVPITFASPAADHIKESSCDKWIPLR